VSLYPCIQCEQEGDCTPEWDDLKVQEPAGKERGLGCASRKRVKEAINSALDSTPIFHRGWRKLVNCMQVE
jgi:hypothetical protein